MDSLICKCGCSRIIPRKPGESDKKYRTRKFFSEQCQRDFQSKRQNIRDKKERLARKRAFKDVDLQKVYKKIERMAPRHPAIKTKFVGDAAELIREARAKDKYLQGV